MRTRIKVCCLASADEARLAIKAGADALGFICAGRASTRTIADSTVADITRMSPPGVSTFLVTNEQTADAIAAHVRRAHTTTVQILSPIDPAESVRLAELEPHLRRVQVVHVESHAALEMIPVYSPYVHAFLLDSGRPNAATPELGGTGGRMTGQSALNLLRPANSPCSLQAAFLHRMSPMPSDRSGHSAWTSVRVFGPGAG
jgi:phosphoribosylanthranilate isomerase